MKDGIQSFLSSSPVFEEIPPEQMAEIAALFHSERHPAGTVILHQGGHSEAVYFVRSGRLAARIQRGEQRETVAYLQPPDIFGELSFVTGRPCVCDVEVVVDAEVASLRKTDLPKLAGHREALLSCLTRVIAGRLQDTVTRGAKARESPVALLHNHPNWEAPRSFAAELAVSLARQTGRKTLLVNLLQEKAAEMRVLKDGASVCGVSLHGAGESFRSEIAQSLTNWKSDFENVILNPVGPGSAAAAATIPEFANWQGDLVGPGDPIPAEGGPGRFVVQSAVRPTLAALSGSRQLIWDAAASEAAYHSGRPVSAKFRRTVDSMARCIAGLQVGLALGGGAAWGWAHIGVLAVLEEAGLPIDVISGCSMGSLIGALRCSGFAPAELKEIAAYWHSRTLRFIEWRVWRMCLLNERKVRKAFRQYFGDRAVNQTEIPYWANAVDIKTGKEFRIEDGSLVDCIRASIALPGLIPPFRRDPHLLVDAGIMDPVPAKLVRHMGGHYTIAINAMAALERQKMSTVYPLNAFDIMTRCMFVMGHEIGQARAEQTANILFTPSLGDITMLQFARAAEIIECGRKATEERLPAILDGYERLKAVLAGDPPAPAVAPPAAPKGS